jgi:hypothetical protein
VTEVLDLASVFERDTVKMQDGTTYELRNQQEFGVVDDHKLRALLKAVDEFKAGDLDASEQDAEAASKMLRDLATMLIVDLKTEIPDWACVAIFEFWVSRAQGENPADPPKKPRPRTTAASSRGSKRSTAATRKPGSKTSRRGR